MGCEAKTRGYARQGDTGVFAGDGDAAKSPAKKAAALKKVVTKKSPKSAAKKSLTKATKKKSIVKSPSLARAAGAAFSSDHE